MTKLTVRDIVWCLRRRPASGLYDLAKIAYFQIRYYFAVLEARTSWLPTKLQVFMIKRKFQITTCRTCRRRLCYRSDMLCEWCRP